MRRKVNLPALCLKQEPQVGLTKGLVRNHEVHGLKLFQYSVTDRGLPMHTQWWFALSTRLSTSTVCSCWYHWLGGLTAATTSQHPPLLASLHHARPRVKGHTWGLSLAELKIITKKKINFNPPKMKPLMCAGTEVPKVILQENKMVSSITVLRYC